jgi:hypothetical protein
MVHQSEHGSGSARGRANVNRQAGKDIAGVTNVLDSTDLERIKVRCASDRCMRWVRATNGFMLSLERIGDPHG